MAPLPAVPSLHRFAAFTRNPRSGNPAGVWLGPVLPVAAEMLRIAAEVGYSETAFAAPRPGGGYLVRYYSPEAEVTFCGHATIATGVLLGGLEGEGRYELHTAAGLVPVEVRAVDGAFEASLTSIVPSHKPVDPELLTRVLGTLGWPSATLDPAIPPAMTHAGAWHLAIAVRTAETLNQLDYDFEELKRLMLDADLTTVHLVWKERDDLYHARDPFPVGGVVEDPATGAAAAAFGGYLRDAGLLLAPASLVILQGEAMGRPSRLVVEVPSTGGIVVRGAAVPIRD